jgi:hypothetical protein
MIQRFVSSSLAPEDATATRHVTITVELQPMPPASSVALSRLCRSLPAAGHLGFDPPHVHRPLPREVPPERRPPDAATPEELHPAAAAARSLGGSVSVEAGVQEAQAGPDEVKTGGPFRALPPVPLPAPNLISLSLALTMTPPCRSSRELRW